MADYKKMYHKLFLEVDDTINKLKKALNDVEDIYIETSEEETNIKVVKEKKEDE